MQPIEYLTDTKGQPKAIVIPLEFWKKILPGDKRSLKDLGQAIEDYCLNRAMNEGKNSPLLCREEALKYLED